ncbi:benenodin family lasso peptide [Oleiagrimonas sp. C23AA]|nr:benenodin family lasso peptide [Oleiagrimonas sp. C23AA]NII09474.1 benenodin family lasso peptide [Oleiagrimonas sp. C23AA]
MNTNEDIRTNASEDVIELGIASVDTQGGLGNDEAIGGTQVMGISED